VGVSVVVGSAPSSMCWRASAGGGQRRLRTSAEGVASVRRHGFTRKFNGDTSPGTADEPDGDKVSNWLPAPDGNFRPILRMYEPGPDVLDGTYPLPKIQRLDR
jgi:hypothetical protein